MSAVMAFFIFGRNPESIVSVKYVRGMFEVDEI